MSERSDKCLPRTTTLGIQLVLIATQFCQQKTSKKSVFLCQVFFKPDAENNCRNNRWHAHDPKDVLIVSRGQSSVTIHVLNVVSCEGDVLSPHFSRKDRQTNRQIDHWRSSSCSTKCYAIAYSWNVWRKTLHFPIRWCVGGAPALAIRSV